MTVLVTGATGGVGREVLAGLLDAGISVRALSRSVGQAQVPAGVALVEGDLDQPQTLGHALEGVSGVFLYARGAQLSDQMGVLKSAGVEQVVLLSTIDAGSDRPYARHNRQRHLDIEIAVREAGFRHTFLRPGAFATNALRFWGHSIATEGVVRLPFPEAQQAPIDPRDIAAVAVEAFRRRDLDGRVIVLTGPESLTQRTQVERLSQVLGRRLSVEIVSEAEARAALARVTLPAYVDLLLAQWADEVGVPAVVTSEVERITRRPATRYDDWATRHVASFGVTEALP